MSSARRSSRLQPSADSAATPVRTSRSSNHRSTPTPHRPATRRINSTPTRELTYPTPIREGDANHDDGEQEEEEEPGEPLRRRNSSRVHFARSNVVLGTASGHVHDQTDDVSSPDKHDRAIPNTQRDDDDHDDDDDDNDEEEEEDDQVEGTPRSASSSVVSALARLFRRHNDDAANVQRAVVLNDTLMSAEDDAEVYSIDTHARTAVVQRVPASAPLMLPPAHVVDAASSERIFSLPQTLTALVTALLAFAVLTFLPQLMTHPPHHRHTLDRLNISALTLDDLNRLFVTTDTLAKARDEWMRQVQSDRQRYVDDVVGTLERSLTSQLNAAATSSARHDLADMNRLVASAVDEAGAMWMERALSRINDVLKPVLHDEQEREVLRGQMIRDVTRQLNETNEKRIAHLTQIVHEHMSALDDRLSKVGAESAHVVRLNADAVNEARTLISSAEERVSEQRREWERIIEDRITAERKRISEEVQSAVAHFDNANEQSVASAIQSQLDAAIKALNDKVASADVQSLIEAKLSAIRHETNSLKDAIAMLTADQTRIVQEWSLAATDSAHAVQAELKISVKELTRKLHDIENAVASINEQQTSHPALAVVTQQIAEVISKQATQERILKSIEHAAADPALKSEWNADIRAALDLYHADGVGLVDYALRSSGGKVVAHSPSHELVLPGSVILSYLSRNIAPTRPAEEVLSAGVSVGECWPMNGASGQLLISLRQPIIITAVTVEHADRRIVPDVTTAPKDITVLGVNEDQMNVARREVEALSPSVLRSIITSSPSPQPRRDGHAHLTDAVQQSMTGVRLGHITYRVDAAAVQTFRLTNALAQHFKHVRIVFHNNHGNSNYTCVYRIRVHGRTE